jgi:hypothetical protein
MLSNSTSSSSTSATRKPALTGYMSPKSTPTAEPTDAGSYEGAAAMTKSLSSAGLMVLVAGCVMLL